MIIIRSPDKFRLSCIIRVEPGGDFIQKYWKYYGKVGSFDEGGGGEEVLFYVTGTIYRIP